ncbi:MAG TPA: ATP-binding cassette domain-containing protein [Jatrophihabitantaceae bacterium]|nr:ATP-binding cassette domain-containing protein [Jatrophihabitantaceae bacterium]
MCQRRTRWHPVRHERGRCRRADQRYAALAAVDGVNLTVELGEIFALLGPNGAGKTTTLEFLEGFRHRDAGRIEVLGLDPGCPVVRPAATRADRLGAARYCRRAVPDRARDAHAQRQRPRSRSSCCFRWCSSRAPASRSTPLC